MIKFILLVVLIVIYMPYDSMAQNTIQDADGNFYPVIKIGNQLWLSQNLKTTKLNDGSPISLVTDNSKWKSLSSPAYCWLNNDADHKEEYGALYNWYAVDTKKLCPKGWHVPSNSDWQILTSFLGDPEFTGALLKEKGNEHWKNTIAGATDQYGFTALPAGFRSSEGPFPVYAESYTVWWSSSKYENDGCNRGLYFSNNILYQSHENCRSGFSVRCVKD